MKYLIICLLIFSNISLANEGKCPLKNLADYDYKDLECHFYLGTKAYRNEVYNVAAAHWQYVVDSPAVYEGDEQLKAMALSTITFLYYNGLGVKQDRDKAVESWKQAVNNGDFEARRHLGFAYSDNSYKNKDLIKAFAWYKSIFLLYPSINDLNEDDRGIYQDAKKSLLLLETKLSQKEQNKALEHAKVFIKKNV